MALPGRGLSEVTSLPSQSLINPAGFAASTEPEGGKGNSVLRAAWGRQRGWWGIF